MASKKEYLIFIREKAVRAAPVNKKELIPDFNSPQYIWPEPGKTILKKEATFGFGLRLFFSALLYNLLIIFLLESDKLLINSK